jgi:solute carrier family 10 (sodium/bile acid cotransporter), member 7
MLRRIMPDPFILILVATIAAATLYPAHGRGLVLISHVANAAIFSLFFFHGLRLERRAVWDGLKHWRLQSAVLITSYGVIPLLGVALWLVFPDLLSPSLWMGVTFLICLPSTVQSAIAYSSMAGGNVAASVIAAALSNLSAVILTPLLFAAIAQAGGGAADLSAIGRIASMLLLPFALGQIAQQWMAVWANRHKIWIGRMDRLTIILTVFTAFSAAVTEGLWDRVSMSALIVVASLVLSLFLLALGSAWLAGSLLGMSREDRITLLFAGAHKSLATGAPMARILFPASQAGLVILPLMIYHQFQLIISAWIAARMGAETR